jgi:hypothetical protein
LFSKDTLPRKRGSYRREGFGANRNADHAVRLPRAASAPIAAIFALRSVSGLALSRGSLESSGYAF